MGRKVTSGVAGGSGLGALNIVSSTITSTTTDGSIILQPNGTGDLLVNADTIRFGDQNVDAVLTTWGTSDAIFNTNNGTNSGSIRIQDGVNGNITLGPNGNGNVQLGTSASTNVILSGTTASSTTSNGALVVAGGTGIAGQATINNINVTAATASSSSSTGALIVAGGAGIGGELFVGSTATVATPTLAGHAATKSYVDAAAGLSWLTVTSNTNAVNLAKYFADTSAGSFTITLPASPASNTTISINDIAGSFDRNNITVARNSQLIMGEAEDFILNVRNSTVTLVFSGATYGWKLV